MTFKERILEEGKTLMHHIDGNIDGFNRSKLQVGLSPFAGGLMGASAGATIAKMIAGDDDFDNQDIIHGAGLGAGAGGVGFYKLTSTARDQAIKNSKTPVANLTPQEYKRYTERVYG